MNRMTLQVLVVGSLLLTACGFNSGLPGDTQGKDLTPAENKALCEAQNEYMKDALSEDERQRFGCIFGGLIAGGFSGNDKAACQRSFDDCMAKEPEASTETSTCEENGSNPQCTATVAEMEDCVEEIAKAFADFANDATCEDLGKEDAISPDDQGPACKVTHDKGCN